MQTYTGSGVESSLRDDSAKRTKFLQLGTAGFFVIGMFTIIVGITMFACGIINIVVGMNDPSIKGFIPGILKTLAGGFTVINGATYYKMSLKAVIKLKRLKMMFVMTCVALLLHLMTFVLGALGVFNSYIYFGDDLLSTCNRDSNSFATVVADSGYSGANLNPNYNPSCVSTNPNCNIDAYPILNYNFNYWYSQMQNNILALYNYYKYVFRYAFVLDSLHVLFSSQFILVEIGLLVIIGYLIGHIEDNERLAEETTVVPDPRLIGSQLAIPRTQSNNHSNANTSQVYAPPAYSAYDSNEPIYINARVAQKMPNGKHSPSQANQNSNWSVYNNNANGHDNGQTIYAYHGPQSSVNPEKF